MRLNCCVKKIKDQIKQLIGDVVHGPGKEIGLQVSGWSGKLAQATGALGAPKVAGRGGLEGYSKWLPPNNRALKPTGGIVTRRHLHGVDNAARGKFPQKVQGVFGI